jgi:hypothetical protein
MKLHWELGKFIAYEKMIFHHFANIRGKFITNGLKFARSEANRRSLYASPGESRQDP